MASKVSHRPSRDENERGNGARDLTLNFRVGYLPLIKYDLRRHGRFHAHALGQYRVYNCVSGYSIRHSEDLEVTDSYDAGQSFKSTRLVCGNDAPRYADYRSRGSHYAPAVRYMPYGKIFPIPSRRENRQFGSWSGFGQNAMLTCSALNPRNKAHDRDATHQKRDRVAMANRFRCFQWHRRGYENGLNGIADTTWSGSKGTA